MIIARKICAWILLGAFQVFVLHQVLPHVHHTHEHTSNAKHKHQHVQDHHHDVKSHHHHDDVDNEEKEQKTDHHLGLLGYLLGNHSHSTGLSHAAVITGNTIQNHKVKNLDGSTMGLSTLSVLPFNTGYSIHIYSPPENLHSTYNPNFNYRGPPAII